MHAIDSIMARRVLRAGAVLGIVVLGFIAIVGSGGGAGFGLPGDCPPGDNCNGPAIPVPVVVPARVTAQVGTAVTFTVTSNIAANLVAYQWYRSSDGGMHFDAIAGATGDTLTIASVNLTDDATTIKVVARSQGINGSAVGHLAVAASPGLVFADGEFPLASWQAATLPDGSASAPAHTEELVATGGHPGAFRRMVIQLAPQAGTGSVGYTWLAGSYAPQGQGAVYVIDYSEDGILLDPGASRSTRSAMLLDQGGRRYIATPADSYPALSTQWDVGQDTRSLRAEDFTLLDGPPCQAGESCPDFSGQGASMRFGYWRISTGHAGDSVSHGIDNWKVTVWQR